MQETTLAIFSDALFDLHILDEEPDLDAGDASVSLPVVLVLLSGRVGGQEQDFSCGSRSTTIYGSINYI